MKYIINKIVVYLFLLILSANTVLGQQAKYILLVTIDGLRPEFYLDSSWNMVNLRHLMQNGVAAQGVNPVFPSVTYPDHTTIITGVSPARHGVYYNETFTPDGRGHSYVYYDSIRVENLFSAMHKARRTTAAIIWPVTVNAPIDFNVPDIAIPGNSDRRSITEKYVTPVGLWKELQDSATGYFRTPADWNILTDELKMDDNIGRMAGYLIEKHRPGLTAIHFASPDHYEHQYGRDGYVVRSAVAGVDRGIKSILEAIRRAGIEDSTAIIITGDHGFENVYHSFNPNTILKSNGLMDNIATDQWKAQFFSSGGSAFLYLKNPKDLETIQKITVILGNLPDSIKQYFKIITKEQLLKIGVDPRVSFALTGLKGTSFGNDAQGILIRPFKAVRGTHGFFPDHKEIQTGFVGYGAGFKKGILIPELNMVDICPIIVKLAGIRFPEMEGKLHAELLQ